MRSLVFALLLLAGCSGSPTSPLIVDTGTVRYQQLEDGFWAILGDGGGKYDVIQGLPEEMKVDGLRVKFVARPSDYDVSGRMWGRMIDIESIHRIE